MHQPRTRESAICPSQGLPELGRHVFRILYRGRPEEAILVRFRGTAYGYLNTCVHMPKALDCEHCHVFDETGRYIRCSMHGITYQPETGLCQSEICAGKSLTSVRIAERDGVLYLTDKRASTHPLCPSRKGRARARIATPVRTNARGPPHEMEHATSNRSTGTAGPGCQGPSATLMRVSDHTFQTSPRSSSKKCWS